jgi:hypothetical protein
MAGHYTDKTEISHDDYLKLEGLLVLGREAEERSQAIVRGIARILGEDGENGHAADAVYSGYSARELLKKSDIVVLPPEPEPSADA